MKIFLKIFFFLFMVSQSFFFTSSFALGSDEAEQSEDGTEVNNDTLFFEQGSEWKYLDDGSNQGTVWQELAFDDSLWSVGHGHMGYGEGDETTFWSLDTSPTISGKL